MPLSITGYKRGKGSEIRYTGLPLPELPRKMLEAQQKAMMAMVTYWLKKFAPKHFEVEAYTRYGGKEDRVYDLRSSRKTSSSWHPRQKKPLVKTGKLRQAFLTGGAMFKVTGSGSGLKVTASWINLPWYTYVNVHGKHKSEGPRKHLELTVINDDEVKELIEVFKRELDKEMKIAEMQNAA